MDRDEIIAAIAQAQGENPPPQTDSYSYARLRWAVEHFLDGIGYQEWNGIRSTSTVNGELDEALFTKMLLSAAMTSPAVTQDQAALLMGKSVVAVDRLAKAVLKVSRIGEDAVAEAEATFPS